ncbi:unnamed protein product [Closterium sp. Naga37s-1]|nr:unnamed protein product [Closterium sp. Naga37s-1]
MCIFPLLGSAASVPPVPPCAALCRPVPPRTTLSHPVPPCAAAVPPCAALCRPCVRQRPLVYCDDYNVRLFGIEKLHPFDSGKWGRIVRFLIEEGRIQPHQVVHPRAASNDDVLLGR